ncbi:MAG: bacteriocin-protection protein [Chloroflexi bacterium]|nr:YdeI/OmpD-associated family protein [Chloroflexota bacterium]MQC25961.1 bacteriocin-protection protein [Chloroflexota bacterium]
MTATPAFFATPEEFRAWLAEHHASQRQLLVGFYKVATDKPSISWEQSVDEALCYGWIDGARKRIDDEAYTIRFSPRRPDSFWSKKNIASMQRLIAVGRVQPAGLAVYQARKGQKSGAYSFEQDEAPKLNAAQAKTFRVAKGAWEFFQDQPPGYRKTIIHWVTSAKQEKTQVRRLARVIEVSISGERVDLMDPFGSKEKQ